MNYLNVYSAMNNTVLVERVGLEPNINQLYGDLIDNDSLFVGQKNLYYSKSDDYGRVYCYEGNAFGLSFGVTTSELNFFDSYNLRDRLSVIAFMLLRL